MKPRIICLSSDSESTFRCMSDGWFTVKNRRKPKNIALHKKADACIDAGKNVLDVIRRLEEAGFEVVRDEDGTYARLVKEAGLG